ncbi:FMN reductase [Pseudonocardia sediminis]|uniref:FMN reductase n=1 Tax=Pseudonocardia sediminis TaxID=1397368 RepID=A0A4Q7UT71_PSEST|nr:NAD(P)H-dependent oxidoreductase [Pseudonocardia sediminis]RZT85002.1 FMN reductase [Pseudonocardia sediminis]
MTSAPADAGPRILALVGSPTPGGKTLTAAHAVLAGARDAGARTTLLDLAGGPSPEAVQVALTDADGIVFASPTHRARCSTLIKSVLEGTQRGAAGETSSPLLGKATAVVQVGASLHHFLAVEDVRSILAGFFAAQVLSPGLYLHSDDYTDDPAGPVPTGPVLTTEAAAVAAAYGRALTEFTAALRAAPGVRALRPQI